MSIGERLHLTGRRDLDNATYSLGTEVRFVGYKLRDAPDGVLIKAVEEQLSAAWMQFQIEYRRWKEESEEMAKRQLTDQEQYSRLNERLLATSSKDFEVAHSEPIDAHRYMIAVRFEDNPDAPGQVVYDLDGRYRRDVQVTQDVYETVRLLEGRIARLSAKLVAVTRALEGE